MNLKYWQWPLRIGPVCPCLEWHISHHLFVMHYGHHVISFAWGKNTTSAPPPYFVFIFMQTLIFTLRWFQIFSEAWVMLTADAVYSFLKCF